MDRRYAICTEGRTLSFSVVPCVVMARPGRRSSAANVVELTTTETRPRLTPPPTLSKQERAIFTATAIANPHLTASDAMLLSLFVQGYTKTLTLGSQPGVADWEKAARMTATLATKLRLTPQSTQDPQTLGRRRADAKPSPIDAFLDGLEDDDDEADTNT
jgi:hypothetical protein